MDLGAIDEDVRFDHAAADALAQRCRNAAQTIEGQSGSRSSHVQTASAEFRGYFSELFSANAQTARGDAQHLADRLRDVSTAVERLADDAREEQNRRQQAREWKQRQDDRNLLEQGWDWVAGGEDPPVGEPAQQLNETVATPRSTPRQTPAPGSGGGGGGTSSARPADLTSFAAASAGLDDLLTHYPGALRDLFSTFEARCDWGSLSCEGVFRGFDTYLTSNDEDVAWANTVAAAFEAAGGEGQVSTVSNASLAAALQAAGIDQARDQLVIDPPTALGSMPTTGYANDPVNTATGNFIEPETDLVFAPASAGLTFGRMYNSFDESTGPFGPGWSSVLDAGLQVGDEAARLTLPDGRVVVFPRLGEGWDRASGHGMWLERVDDGFVASGNAGERWTFDAAGDLLTVTTGPGTTVRHVRDGDRLVRLEHERGRSVEIVWGDGVVTGLRADDGREVAYDYDDAGRLVAVTGAAGRRTYGWDDGTLIVSVSDADGVVEAENTYDEHRRVVRQRSQHGRLTRFAYLPGRVTEVSDLDGTRANTWIHDGKGRLVGVIDADGYRQSMSYDAFGNRVAVTDRDGSSTVREHDTRGRLVRMVLPSGGEVTYGYDDADRVTTVVAEAGSVTEMVYEDDQRSPSVIVDPEGGRTEMQWRDGLLRQVTDPEGVVVRFDYDTHGELLATTDAAAGVARIERDQAGRVVGAVTPGGARTVYDRDAAGSVVRRIDPDGSQWRYEYTAGGRLIATTDPLGARTTVELGVHGESERTIDPLGRVVTRTLDELGNVAGLELPDGTAWTYAHDALSRLRTITDPLGGRWEYSYGSTGQIESVTDPTGVSTTVTTQDSGRSVLADDGLASVLTQLDDLGRPVSRELPDGSSELYTYDRCGRVVEAVDAEGGLTVLRRDRAGRLVEAVDPTGATRRFEYDACGRLAATIDPLGARTTIEYDADHRVARTISPTGETAWFERDACGRVVTRHVPGLGTSHWEYDAVGRVVRVRDAWRGRRRFRYDDAGQLVEAIDGVGGVTRYEYDENGACVRVIDPLGNTTTREFDALYRCVAESDPLGRTTRGGYDAAGRQVWQQLPDGHHWAWEFDETGRHRRALVDGETVSETRRDARGRTRTTVDSTAGGAPVTHEWHYDRRGGLVQRSRDGRAVTWDRDAAGRVSAVTTPNGETARYDRDASGRVVALHHPSAGQAQFVHDADGRLVRASAAGTTQEWQHVDGHVVTHERTQGSVFERTTIERDADGRIVAVDRGGRTTRFQHDDACRLTRVSTPDAQTALDYDEASRLVRERVDDLVVTHEHDAAGQLLRTSAGGATTRHTYDEVGRRVRSEGPGGVRVYSWTARGTLAAVRVDGPEESGVTTLHVDATATLAQVDGTPIDWDIVSARPVQVGDLPVVTVNGFTSVGDGWSPVGWRQDRSTGDQPWDAPAAASLPHGVGIGASGEVLVAGLEWMQARAYDPLTRGFLSVDPVDPVPGTGWSGNPYSYAGNDPLHALDPTGLRPVTDEELRGYIENNTGAWGTFSEWATEGAGGWILGGAMVLAGGVLVATGVGGPAGAILIGAGADVLIQKATTGTVDWGSVALGAAAGGGIGAAIKHSRHLVHLKNLTGPLGSVARGATEGFGSGLVTATYSVATSPGPHTVGSFVGDVAQSTVTGAATNSASDGLGALGRSLRDAPPTPTPDVPPASNPPSPGPPSTPPFPDALTSGNNAGQNVSVFQRADGVYGTSNDVAGRGADLGQEVTAVPGTENLSRGEARSVQQALIERAGDGYGGNNAISPNHDYYDDAVAWGENWLQTNGGG